MMTNVKSFEQRRSFGNRNRFKIGVFGANCSSGRAVTTVPERWSGSWDDNVALARMAEASGFDFLLPIARWRGMGGVTDWEGATFETTNWATGLLASTRAIGVFATVHVQLVSPVVAAKMFATADHVGHGRFGLNVVCGWNEDEFGMFGVDLEQHERRYRYAQEWLDVVNRVWEGGGEFDFDGELIRLKQVVGKPAPYGGSRPLLMNAGASPAGQAFALRNCDAFFTVVGANEFPEIAAHVGAVKAEASRMDREIDVYTVGVMCCRPTLKEAQDYYHYSVIENADWAAIDNMIRARKMPIETFSAAQLQQTRERLASGMGGMSLLGDPDHIAERLVMLSDAGIRGIGLSVVNYLRELPYFAQEVFPRLERAGVRVPVPQGEAVG